MIQTIFTIAKRDMKKCLLITGSFLLMININAQKLIYKNYYQADSLLRIIKENYKDNHQLTYTGKSFSMGHYSTPEEQKPYQVTYRLSHLDEKFNINATLIYYNKPYTAKMVFSEDSCSYNDYGKKEIKTVSLKKKVFSYYYLPQNVVNTILKNKASLHYVGANNGSYRLGFSTSYGAKFYAVVSQKTNLIKKVIQLEYDALYGDSYKEMVYSDYKNNIPHSITVNNSQMVSKELHLDTVSVEKPPTKTSNTIENITIDTIAKRLFVLKLNHYNNKVIVAEHQGFLVVYEAPINVSVGNEIITFLKEQFDNKPIQYCFLSHHHPDHAGAISAFANINSKIVTTKGNVLYFNKLSAGIHTLSDSSFYPLKNKIDYIIIDSLGSETFFKKSLTPVVVYESGITTDHVNEFLYFYFPKQKTLFVGDLVIFPKEGIRDQKKRALSVYNIIKSKKLKVDRIYTGWPLKDQKEYGTMADLENALLKHYPGLK